MIATTIPRKTVRPGLVLLLAFLGVLSLAFVWRGVGKMLTMRTQAASTAEFEALTNEADAKIVLEITEAPQGACEEKCWKNRARRITPVQLRMSRRLGTSTLR